MAAWTLSSVEICGDVTIEEGCKLIHFNPTVLKKCVIKPWAAEQDFF